MRELDSLDAPARSAPRAPPGTWSDSNIVHAASKARVLLPSPGPPHRMTALQSCRYFMMSRCTSSRPMMSCLDASRSRFIGKSATPGLWYPGGSRLCSRSLSMIASRMAATMAPWKPSYCRGTRHVCHAFYHEQTATAKPHRLRMHGSEFEKLLDSVSVLLKLACCLVPVALGNACPKCIGGVALPQVPALLIRQPKEHRQQADGLPLPHTLQEPHQLLHRPFPGDELLAQHNDTCSTTFITAARAIAP
jgi:hypothetical protein